MVRSTISGLINLLKKGLFILASIFADKTKANLNKYDTVVGEAQQFSSNLIVLGSVYTN